MIAPPAEDTMLDWAVYYHTHGWSVLPVNPSSKKPCVPTWTPYRTCRADEPQVRDWFRNPDHAISVILGAVSSDLAALDFDDEERFAWWTQTHPELAKVLPTEKTARGYHVLFECDPTPTQRPKGQAIELLSEGAYVILTPSPGKRWLHPPNGRIPRIDPFTLGLEAFGITRPEGKTGHFTEETEEKEEMASVSSVSSVSSVNCLLATDEQQLIDEAISKTLPTHEGQRNRCILDLCRRLKAIQSLADRPARDLRTITQDWHARAHAVIGTKPFEKTWADFVYAWNRVKWPHGVQLKAAVHKATEDIQTPPEAMSYEDPKTQLLVRVCWQLQHAQGNQPFYLSMRTAGEIVGLSHTEAGKRLEMFQEDGLLAIVAAHTNIKATRYRYIGK